MLVIEGRSKKDEGRGKREEVGCVATRILDIYNYGIATHLIAILSQKSRSQLMTAG
ncbi:MULTISPECIES: hypothetical protein [unclassified Microcoleus]|uniref:hypothetical protein n=1 Tax=unclassified Microcoleus TaxID=2642155 RepID=UPI0025D47A91|nr:MULTISPECIES: hypothetical protein [unclassified Microcoleus]